MAATRATVSEKVAVVGAELGIAPDRDQGEHEQSTTQVPVAHFADPDFFLDRFAGAVLPRIQASVGHPLAYIEVRRKQDEFAEQLQSTGLSNTGEAQQ